MSKEAQLAGISPYTLRLASYYAQLGVGEYSPKGYAQFNRVVVKQQEPFEVAPSGRLTESFSLIRVEFWAGGELQRYVDFALTVAGFSGKPVVAAV